MITSARERKLRMRQDRGALRFGAYRRMDTSGTLALPAAANGHAMGHLVDLVRHHADLDLRMYRQTLVGQRLEGRIASTRTDSLETYVSLLREQPREIGRLARAVRKSAISAVPNDGCLAQLALALEPVVASRRSSHANLRISIPACTTGEETYLLAMLLAAAMTRHSCNPRSARIIASDPDEASLRIARRGVFYAPDTLAGTPADLRATGPRLEGRSARVACWLRNMIRFRSHDVTRDPPLRNVDLIVCRNVLAGLQPRLRRRVLADLRDALRPGACVPGSRRYRWRSMSLPRNFAAVTSSTA